MISKCLPATYLSLYRFSFYSSDFITRTYLAFIKFAPSDSSVLSSARKVPLLTTCRIVTYLASIIFGVICFLIIQFDDFSFMSLRWFREQSEWLTGIIKVPPGNHMRLRLASRSFVHASSTLRLLTCYSSGYVILAGCDLIRFIRAFFHHAIRLV